MGNAHDKAEDGPQDHRSGLSHHDCVLIKQSWQDFTANNKEYGLQIFIAFFTKAPETIELFRNFRGKPLTELAKEPQFRAHAWAVGYQLASMVEYAEDSTLLEALIRKNAKSHTTRRGVRPEHFVLIGKTVIEVMKKKSAKPMSPAAIASWEKLFYCMGKITTTVYEEEIDRGVQAEKSAADSRADVHSTASRSTVSEGGSTANAQAVNVAAGGSVSSPGAAMPTAAQTGTPETKHDQPTTANSEAHQGAPTGSPPAAGAAPTAPAADAVATGAPTAP